MWTMDGRDAGSKGNNLEAITAVQVRNDATLD